VEPLIVFAGAGAGGAVRYALGSVVQQMAGTEFPWATLVINASGSVTLGLAYFLLEGTTAAPEWRLLIGVGFCGGYTTFSTFSYETIRLLQGGDWRRAVAYILASVILSLVGVLLGFRIASSILERT
jgi:fluoride exporter